MPKKKEQLLNNIYKDIERNPFSFQKDLAKKYQCSERTIRRYCKILKDNGFICYSSSNDKKQWISIKSFNITK